MKLNYNELSSNLIQGILALEKFGFLTTGEDGIPVRAVCGEKVIVRKSEQELQITYDTECHFYMALARCIGMQHGTQEITPRVKKLGVMLDCSRNAVATPDMVKRLICHLVLAGYTYLELYTEDTYELPGEPYFGYKRGRYSGKELSEIIAFADIFGFEMVPCIQTLAHLRSLRNWKVYFDHIDTEDILLVEDERTYNLIRKMLRFCKEVFHTKRINIGTDEAFRIGRGQYQDIHGVRPTHELYLEHLNVVFQMCKEEGLEPEFWADAFYDRECKEEHARALFNGTQTPIYWYYGILEKEKHVQTIEKLKVIAGKTIYAGTFRKWSGYGPSNKCSEMEMGSAFDAAIASNIDNILMTTWGDGGDECSVFAVTSSMWYAAQIIYPCDVNMDQIVKTFTGYTMDEWRYCDEIDYVESHEPELICTASKDLLSNDFLLGIMDYHIPDNADERYQELFEEYSVLANRESQFAYIFESYAALCQAIIGKATYSKRLYRAYQAKDLDAIRDMVKELPIIKQNIQNFFEKFRKLWLTENKGFGFEISDIRIGSLLARIDTVTIMLEDYLEGRLDKIYELEEERISFWSDRPEKNYSVYHGDWPYNFTVNYVLHYGHTI